MPQFCHRLAAQESSMPCLMMTIARARVALLLVACCLGLLPVAAPAATNLLDLKVEYSAESVIGSGADAKSGHLWRTPTSLRHEMTESGQTETVIVRFDEGKAWLLLPALRMALGTSLDAASQLAGASSVLSAVSKLHPVAVGSDTLEGMRATKYRVQMDDPKAGQFDGFVWSTTQGVVLKVDGEGEQGGRRGAIHMLFRNIRIGPQVPALFDPPSDYRQVTVAPSEIEAMLKAMAQLQRMRSGTSSPTR